MIGLHATCILEHQIQTHTHTQSSLFSLKIITLVKWSAFVPVITNLFAIALPIRILECVQSERKQRKQCQATMKMWMDRNYQWYHTGYGNATTLRPRIDLFCVNCVALHRPTQCQNYTISSIVEIRWQSIVPKCTRCHMECISRSNDNIT